MAQVVDLKPSPQEFDRPGPSAINDRVAKAESTTLYHRLWTKDENGDEAAVNLTGKTVAYIVQINGAEVVFDNGANTGLTLSTQSGKTLGRVEIAITSSKGATAVGSWKYELWNVTDSNLHGAGRLIVEDRDGPT